VLGGAGDAVAQIAYNPIPADGSLHTESWVLLSWSAAGDPDSYEVYFGESFADVRDGAEGTCLGETMTTSFSHSPLFRCTTYYWRIDQIIGFVTYKGDVWSFTVPPSDRILHVDADVSGGANTGETWADAYTDLQTALHRAVCGDEIRVASGVYKPTAVTDRTATFRLKDGVIVKGGYKGGPDGDTWNPELYATVLSGEISGPGMDDNSYHVVTGSGCDRTAVLDGFIIMRGNADGLEQRGRGGGMYNGTGSPTVRNCRFYYNRARSGGGMYSENGSSPLVVSCELGWNSAERTGGGMYNGYTGNPEVRDCTFTANEAYEGGAMRSFKCDPSIEGCRFVRNKALDSGGAICNEQGDSTIRDCEFNGNEADDSGGGIYAYDCEITVEACSFENNKVPYSGGAICSESSDSTISDCIFNGNKADDFGGGIYAGGGEITLEACSFENNARWSDSADVLMGGGMYCNGCSLKLFGCTFSGNSALFGGGISAMNQDASTLLINCRFTGNSAWGAGGFSCDGGGATLVNCAFLDNRADIGAGVWNEGVAMELINCTLTRNTAEDGGGAVYGALASGLTLTSCIVWANDPDEMKREDATASITATYSTIQGGGWPGENLNVDPQFVDADGRLGAGSPCIDAGDNTAVPHDIADLDGNGIVNEPIQIDLDGGPRFVEADNIPNTGCGSPPIVDMGAYEWGN
jgi:predicted outer membrane repeat protein